MSFNPKRNMKKSKGEESKTQASLATKRQADNSPKDSSRKKRFVFADLTNAVTSNSQQKELLAEKNGEKSKGFLKKVTRGSTAIKSEQASKCKSKEVHEETLVTSQDSFVTCESDISRTPADKSAYEDSIAKSAEDSPEVILPPGVVDFDKETINEQYSEPGFAMDIFRYYKKREEKFLLDDYLTRQTEVSKGMRSILVDWMVEVQESFELNHETLYLGVKLVDHYLNRHIVSKSSLQLLGATATFIACKFDERCPPLIDDFLYICDDAYGRKEMIAMEVSILKTMDFDIGMPLSYRFVRRYARCAKVSMEILTLARFILEMSLMEYEFVRISDSRIAAAALLLSLKMKSEKWTPTLEYYTDRKEKDLLDLMYKLNANISTTSPKNLQTVRTKYGHRVFFEVAKIPPLPPQAT